MLARPPEESEVAEAEREAEGEAEDYGTPPDSVATPSMGRMGRRIGEEEEEEAEEGRKRMDAKGAEQREEEG